MKIHLRRVWRAYSGIQDVAVNSLCSAQTYPPALTDDRSLVTCERCIKTMNSDWGLREFPPNPVIASDDQIREWLAEG